MKFNSPVKIVCDGKEYYSITNKLGISILSLSIIAEFIMCHSSNIMVTHTHGENPIVHEIDNTADNTWIRSQARNIQKIVANKTASKMIGLHGFTSLLFDTESAALAFLGRLDEYSLLMELRK